jgi:hypothetical protein
MKNLRLLPIIFVLFDACVDRLELPVYENEVRLVVDGLLTNDFGTHSIRIFYSPGLDNRLTKEIPVENAQAKIVDHAGNEFPLTYTAKGVYVLENFEGIPGNAYQLRFSTSDGRAYESSMQTLVPAGEITNMQYVLTENVINPNDLAGPHDAFRIFIDAKNAAGSPGLFRWRWSSIYEAKTFPELRKKWVPNSSPPVYLFDPIPCSGYVAVNGGLSMYQSKPCECCDCWVTEYSKTSMVSDNHNAQRPEFAHVQIAQVPVTWQKFQAKFYIKVEQLSLSDEVYEFWKRVQAQQQGTGSIFQPNVISVKGNIRCTSHPDEDVAGIFSVAGSTTRDIFIKRSDFNKRLETDTLITDCRQQYPGSTNVKPPFW